MLIRHPCRSAEDQPTRCFDSKHSRCLGQRSDPYLDHTNFPKPVPSSGQPKDSVPAAAPTQLPSSTKTQVLLRSPRKLANSWSRQQPKASQPSCSASICCLLICAQEEFSDFSAILLSPIRAAGLATSPCRARPGPAERGIAACFHAPTPNPPSSQPRRSSSSFQPPRWPASSSSSWQSPSSAAHHTAQPSPGIMRSSPIALAALLSLAKAGSAYICLDIWLMFNDMQIRCSHRPSQSGQSQVIGAKASL